MLSLSILWKCRVEQKYKVTALIYMHLGLYERFRLITSMSFWKMYDHKVSDYKTDKTQTCTLNPTMYNCTYVHWLHIKIFLFSEHNYCYRVSSFHWPLGVCSIMYESTWYKFGVNCTINSPNYQYQACWLYVIDRVECIRLLCQPYSVKYFVHKK